MTIKIETDGIACVFKGINELTHHIYGSDLTVSQCSFLDPKINWLP